MQLWLLSGTKNDEVQIVDELKTIEDVARFQVEPDRPFYSAGHEEIMSGATSDIYFIKTREILEKTGAGDTPVTAEVFGQRPGILAGTGEVRALLAGRGLSIEALPEGSAFGAKEVVMRIRGPYNAFGIYETVLLGMLASSSGWATATREAVEAADGRDVFSFGARHVHPAVAPVLERAALLGGAAGASCILAAKLAGREPVGTVPHAMFLVLGDTLTGALAYHEHMPKGQKRLFLVDTFQDEAVESLRLAQAMGSALDGVRLDSPSERGGVTPGLVREVRARLDGAGHSPVKIFVSGGLSPDRIRLLGEAGADAFGVGSHISGASPIDMTMDLKEIGGVAVAKRGRIPGVTPTDRLVAWED